MRFWSRCQSPPAHLSLHNGVFMEISKQAQTCEIRNVKWQMMQTEVLANALNYFPFYWAKKKMHWILESLLTLNSQRYKWNFLLPENIYLMHTFGSIHKIEPQFFIYVYVYTYACTNLNRISLFFPIVSVSAPHINPHHEHSGCIIKMPVRCWRHSGQPMLSSDHAKCSYFLLSDNIKTVCSSFQLTRRISAVLFFFSCMYACVHVCAPCR